ncbi:hypothetical protein [Undibacterium baiyunense]|uniref:Uncharacterized protein n=1 Tax=Undibacterium baiyunense TaxID=2828731 RepID=A0A941DCT6_9BURK|nr:hypothetical protein [Undibacterium baiyunense]MBR7745666.1 hypothetical protein [Undibacterium baiyunense]
MNQLHQKLTNKLNKSSAKLLAALLSLSVISTVTSAQVLTQTNKDLGHGYRFQESKQINVSGRWHSNQSFKFLYFDKRYLCQCTEFSISPSGRYAIFQISGSLEIASFNRDKLRVNNHPKLPKGKLKQVIWSKNEKQAELHIQAEESAVGNASDLKEVIKKRVTLK